jgi:hypothetical protein
MRAKSFSDDADTAATDAGPEPDYAFEGFDVVFSTKIALMPPGTKKAGSPDRRQDVK